jgi:XRE family transcriptional regulator, regulator of sulfur utilization
VLTDKIHRTFFIACDSALDLPSFWSGNAGMITRRDFVVAAVSILATAGVVALAQTAAKPVMHSSVFNWSNLKVEPTKMGERRFVFDSPTPALAELEMHITTLNPGESPHPPHQHPEEELMIIREGTLEALQGGKTNIVEAGGVIFEASNEFHGLRNVGTNRATYYVLKIAPRDLTRTKTQ